MKNDYPEFWESVVGEKNLYQMGPLSHRVYLLDLLKTLHVESLLDIGCGTAPIYDLLINAPEDKWDNIKKYKGVDPSEAMIRSCQANFPGGDFEVQDATALKEFSGSFDCCLMMHSLDYVYDYAAAIKECARVAKKYVVIILWRELKFGHNDENNLNGSKDNTNGYDWRYARLQEFSYQKLLKEFNKNHLKVLILKNDKDINKEGKTNTLIVLRKSDA